MDRRALACDLDGPAIRVGARERGLRRFAVAVGAAAVAASVGCQPQGSRTTLRTTLRPAPMPAAVARGADTYGRFCAGCHGVAGGGNGPFARAFGLEPPDLRAPAFASTSDAALLDRLVRGTPLEVPPIEARPAESRAVDALADYLPRLARTDWDVLRAGRVVYEEACAACHGVYGRADGAIAYWLGAPDLIVARERHSDAALARISEAGTGLMAPLFGNFDRAEIDALTAYIRHLSDGFAVYDMRCAACHGDDGQGLYTRDLIPPATAAPSLRGAHPRNQLLAMLRRERGVMPHFAELDRRRLEDVVAYLRAVVLPRPPLEADS